MDIQKYSTIIPTIRTYQESLEKQNLMWSVVSMVGKVNNQGLPPQLINSISSTQSQFESLKTELIDNLVSNYLNRAEVDLRLKSQAFIDILNRNLFERTADVGFLATDDVLKQYLLSNDFSGNARHEIEQRLQEYVAKYSVYCDVVVFTKSLEIVARLNKTETATHSNHPIILEALETNEFIEFDHKIDGVFFDTIPLYYLQRIESNGQVLGVLCLSFKLFDELQRIEKALNTDELDVAFNLISDQQGTIYPVTSNSAKPNNKADLKTLIEFSHNNSDIFGYCSQTSGYQGFMGLPWKSLATVSTKPALSIKLDASQNHSLREEDALFPKDLNELNLQISTALLIVIINGKISSLKNNVQAFLPILDSFQEIGSQIRYVFAESIRNIHQVARETMTDKAMFAANISLDVMDRNLYERANDCRWWALNPVFAERIIEANPENYPSMDSILRYINGLYTVYTVLFVYDHRGKILASSSIDSERWRGQSISYNDGSGINSQLESTQQYRVSNFEASPFYEDKPTYIYHAAIRNPSNNKTIGGIGIVFDSEPEFKAILEDFLPKNKDGSIVEGCFSFFIDHQHRIISASDNDFGIQPGKDISQTQLQQSLMTEKQSVFETKIQESRYIVARATSKGYREYKIEDGYVNDIQCFVLIKS